MDLFAFVSWFVAVVCLVTLAWPLNVPLLAFAYKVRRGSQPLDMEGVELWTRSALGSVGLAGRFDLRHVGSPSPNASAKRR